MKIKTFTLWVSCALTSVSLLSISTGCKKSNDSNNSGSGISATAGAQGFQSKYAVGDSSQSNSFIILTGYQVTSGDTILLEVDIPDTFHINQPSTFIGGSELSYVNFKTGVEYNGSGWPPTHGSVTVTSVDASKHTIAGVFSGTLVNLSGPDTDTLVITNGHFNTTYAVTP